MKNKIFLLYVCCILCFSCSGKKANINNIEINRFDKDLFEYLEGRKQQQELLNNHQIFLDLYGDKIIGIGKSDSLGFFERLSGYFSEPTLRKIYKDELSLFENTENISQKLSIGFDILKTEFPDLKIPSIYMHVSGLNQNIIVTDSILSISVDKYLGSDYPLYQDYFYDYQRQNMTPERIVPDYFLGFLMTEFPFLQNNSTLLDNMVYAGKLRYILSTAMPESVDSTIIGYTEIQYDWCVSNESHIWKSIIEQKHLYSSEPIEISKYMQDAPFTSTLTPDSPGRIGVWIGYQIIKSYIKQNPQTSLQDLMKENNALEIFKKARYKP